MLLLSTFFELIAVKPSIVCLIILSWVFGKKNINPKIKNNDPTYVQKRYFF